MAEKSIKDIVEQAIIDLIQDGKIEIQDENGDKIDDLSLGINESDDEDFEDDMEDDSDEEENNQYYIGSGALLPLAATNDYSTTNKIKTNHPK